jgi:cytochrome c-type biogenesis protein CcsB
MLEYQNLISFLCKFSFSTLVITMFYYWIRLTFFPRNKEKDIGILGAAVSNVSLTFLLILRWLESGHFPFSNLFESLLFLSWTVTAIHLIMQNFVNSSFLVGVIFSPISVFTNAFATFGLPNELQKSTSLVPALQSNWLAMHVSVMILSYGFLLSGSLLAIAFLLLEKFFLTKNFSDPVISKENQADTLTIPVLSSSSTSSLFIKKNSLLERQSNFADSLATELIPRIENSQNMVVQDVNAINFSTLLSATELKNSNNIIQSTFVFLPKHNKLGLLSKLDNGSYRSIGLGFAFLTLGILSGAVWANEAWGSYWSWDPKETWAFITWLVYAIYLHIRLNKGWSGQKAAFIATLGFFSVWLCFLGVNLLGIGLHSYGWFS